MTTQQRWLVGFYALIAVGALCATWSQNLQLMTPGAGPWAAYPIFLELTKANAASRSITVDIGFFFMAAAAFMIIEARRLGVQLVWLYIVAGFLVAISVSFPLFMIARELRLGRAQGEGWRLTALDLAGLAATCAATLWLIWQVLS